MCMVSQILSRNGQGQPNIVATVDVTTNTPINQMYHYYQSAWIPDPCTIEYRLQSLTAGAGTLCNIVGLTIVCEPDSAAQAG